MSKDSMGISILNKLQITTKEVIAYLESVDSTNEQILQVLQKKPSLPEYEKLPWVIESKIDKSITRKLKGNKSLTAVESIRLKEILTIALTMLKKGHPYETKTKRTKGLQEYIEKLA